MKVKKSSKIAQDPASQNLPPAAAIFQESEYTSDEVNCSGRDVDNEKEKCGVSNYESEKTSSVKDESCENSSYSAYSKLTKLDKHPAKLKQRFDTIAGKLTVLSVIMDDV